MSSFQRIQEPEKHTLAGAGSKSGAGALPEIAGLGAVAIVAMALLVFGYNARKDTAQTATAPTPPATSAAATDQMTDPARPRTNPADMSKPPTQYPLGSGSPTTTPTNPATQGSKPPGSQ